MRERIKKKYIYNLMIYRLQSAKRGGILYLIQDPWQFSKINYIGVDGKMMNITITYNTVISFLDKIQRSSLNLVLYISWMYKSITL